MSCMRALMNVDLRLFVQTCRGSQTNEMCENVGVC